MVVCMIVDDLNTVVEMGNDAATYMKLRLAAEEWERQAALGNPTAERLLDMVKKFAALCMLAKENRL